MSKKQKELLKEDFNEGDLSIYENLTKFECLLIAIDVASQKYESAQYLCSLSVALLQKIEMQGENPKLVIKKTITKSDLDHGQLV